MPYGSFFMELVKNVGFPAVIFLIWYLYHESQVRLWTTTSENNAKIFERILSERNLRDERDFDLMKGIVETMQFQGAIVARMEGKIDNNQFCPIVREKSHA